MGGSRLRRAWTSRARGQGPADACNEWPSNRRLPITHQTDSGRGASMIIINRVARRTERNRMIIQEAPSKQQGDAEHHADHAAHAPTPLEARATAKHHTGLSAGCHGAVTGRIALPVAAPLRIDLRSPMNRTVVNGISRYARADYRGPPRRRCADRAEALTILCLANGSPAAPMFRSSPEPMWLLQPRSSARPRARSPRGQPDPLCSQPWARPGRRQRRERRRGPAGLRSGPASEVRLPRLSAAIERTMPAWQRRLIMGGGSAVK